MPNRTNMKESKKSISHVSIRVIILIILIACCNFLANSQEFLISGGQSTLLREYSSSQIGLGTGATTPTAKFLILSKSGISSDPLFKTDSWRGGISEASVSLLGTTTINGTTASFGISQVGESFINIFEGPLLIKNWLTYTHNTTHINGILIMNQCLDDQLAFKFQVKNQNNDWDTPLTLDVTDGVITHGLLSCDRFKMSSGAMENAVMLSDQEGNASWADPSTFHDDDWISTTRPGMKNPGFNIYLNEKYQNAGIGTRDPQSKLHIVDGNIMISRSPTEAPGSRNGSILFGKVIDPTCPLGEWGIEYLDDQVTYRNGGLNFWKVYTDQNSGKNHVLFIRNDGFVGIGTSAPQSELSVNGKITAKEIEVLLTGWVPDYVFEESYDLKPLSEVEDFIKSHKHLPGVRSAQEIQENGMNVGEMNNVLLKKVEELTLYVIELKKEIERIKEKRNER